MTGRVLPTIGNIVITEDVHAVRLELRTFVGGKPVAFFTYREIDGLIAALQSVRQPAPVADELDDMLA
jgi:hypothetical protein